MHGRVPIVSPNFRSGKPKSKIDNPKLLGLAVLAFLLIIAGVVPRADAQQPKKVPRIGYLAAVSPAADAPRKEAFRQALKDFGYIEGQNILIEYRHEDRNFERLPKLAAELVQLKTDVFVTVTTNAALAARNANKSIPHVFMGVTDPVTAGLVDSLPRPGGNSTGITNMAAILSGKRLELLKEIVPKLSRVAVLWDSQAPGSAPQWEDSHVPARQLGLQLHSMQVSSADKYEEAFKEAAKAQSGALAVTLNPLANSNSKRIADLAMHYRWASVCARADYADNGNLMAYGPGYSIEGFDGARYLARILKGAKPADIPVEQPTKFEMVINLKTAKQIGVTISPHILARADRVIK
jgi:putative tryptophan/tyrosine transport system substrate-binding protein